MRKDLQVGTVTLVFTDIEGSTKLLHELGAEAYAEALADHRRILRDAFVRHGGVEIDTQGDAFFFAFPDARGRSSRLTNAAKLFSPVQSLNDSPVSSATFWMFAKTASVPWSRRKGYGLEHAKPRGRRRARSR